MKLEILVNKLCFTAISYLRIIEFEIKIYTSVIKCIELIEQFIYPDCKQIL